MANNLSNEEIEKRRKRAEEARRKSLEKRNAGSPVKSIDTAYYTSDHRKYAEEMQKKAEEKAVKALPVLQAKQTGAAGNFASVAGLPVLEKAQASPASTEIPALDPAVVKESASNGVLIPEGATTEQIAQILDVWNADGYKMNDAEKKSFKAFKDSYMAKGTPQYDAYRQENSVPMAEAYLSGADLDLYNKFLETDKKSSSLYSFAGNLLNSMPFAEAILKGGDQLSEKLFGTDAGSGEHLDSVKNSSQQNPLAAIAGTLAGQIGGYGAVKDVVSSIPVLGKAVSAMSDKISKIPGLGKYGQNISNILADTSIDTIAETLPQAIENVQSGKNAGEVASEALKGTAANVGFNVLGEGVTAGIPALTNYLKNRNGTPNVQDAVETFSKPVLDDVAEHTKEVAEGLSDTVENAPETITPASIPNLVESVSESTDRVITTIPSRKLRSTVTSASEAVDYIQRQYKGNEVLASELKKSFTDLLDNPTDENWERMIKTVQQYEGTIKGKTTKTRYGDMQKYSNEVRDVLNMFDSDFATELDAAKYPKEVVAQIEQMYSGPAKYRVDYQSGSTKKNYKKTFDTLEDAQNFMDKTPDATFSVKDASGEYVLADAEKLAAEKQKNLLDLNLQFFGDEPAADVVESVAENVDTGAKSISQSVEVNSTGNEPEIPTGMKERGYAESIRNKTDLPEEVKNEFVREPEIYEQLSNATTKARAEEIMARGTEPATTEFRRMLESKDPAAVPLGRFIADDLITQGRSEEAVQVLRDMSKALTESGQFSQAAAITLMKSDPTTALQYVQRSLDDVNNAGKKKFGNKWKDIQLTDEQIKQFSECAPGDSEGIKKAMQNVGNHVAKQYPATKWEQFVELTKVGMLLNPRTNMRNVVSNAMMRPVRSLTDRVSALGQNAYTLIDPDYKPTQSILPANKQQKKLATEAFETVRDSILGDSSRWNNVKSGVQDKQVFKGSAFSKVFDNITGGALTKLNQAMGKDISPSVLETARNLTYWLLEKGDDVFVKKNFEDRMSSYIRAQGIQNLEDIPEDAFSVAIEEAMKATFKDDTALSRALSGVKKNLGPLGEVIMPFTKTPANLAMRGYDYSPASIITAAKNIKDQAGATKFFDDLSKTAVGTAGVFLGYQLTKHGILEGALSEDKDQAAFQKQQGKLPFSVNINGNYYTYDFAQPASIPLILGATIYDSMKDSDNAAETIKQGAVAAVDSWMGLSPLQSLSDIFGGYDTPAENLFNEVAEFPQRVIPAALGATARVVDPVQRQTFSNDDILKTQIDTAISKIPVLSKTLPASYDTWGNEIRRSDSVGEGMFAQYLSPGQLGNESTTQIDGEIERLFEVTGNDAVFPKKASWSVNSQKLTNREYSDYQRQMGTVSYDMALQLIGASNYDALPDDTKADLLADMYSLSDTMAKHELFGTGLGNKEKMAGVYEDYGSEGVVNYLLAKKLADLDGNGSLKKDEITSYLDTQDMSNTMREYYFSILSSAKKNPYSK